MDYLKDYNYFYNKTYATVEKKIKDYLIKANTESRTFNFALNQIIKKDEELLSKKSKIKSNKSLTLLEALHKQSLSQYNVNGIELSLKNEVYKAFSKLNADDLPINYSYQKFVGDLGSLYALDEVIRLFRNHSNLYQMMFELNDFSDFEITTYGTLIEEKPIFKLLHQKLYPYHYENVSETKSTETDGVSNEEDNNPNSKKNTEEEDKIKILKFNISKFTEDEKIFLQHVYYYSTTKIPLPEYIKLMMITNDINGFSLFTFGSANNRFYDKMNKGINYYSTKTQRIFIDSVIIKLKPFGLTNINIAVNLIKSKIN